jgi:hypothetical protein
MKKYLRKVVKYFKELADAKLLAFARHVVASVAAAGESFPNPTPALAVISVEIDTYANLLQLSAGEGKVQIALKNKSKQTLLQMLSQLADYVNMTAQGNEVVLTKSGYELSKIPEPIIMKAPEHLVVCDGNNSGELVLKFKRVKGALSYLYQYTTDPLLSESSWVSKAATTTSFTFTGLTKCTNYYCRVVAIGCKKQSVNSIVVSRVSQ